VREWTLTLPREFPLWELEPRWTLKSSKSNYRGQNSLEWSVSYIIGKLLECRCLKWVCMTHLESETQVIPKRRAKNQIGSLTLNHWKLGIDPISLCVGDMPHIVGKLSTRTTTLV
jgi:hypothetical protein